VGIVDSSRSSAEITDGWLHGISGTAIRGDRLVHVEHVWNTAVTITIAGIGEREVDARRAVAMCAEGFAEVDRTFSTYRALSEVTLYRNGLTALGRHSRDFDDVLRACQELRDLTRGAFDPWAVPGGYDPSGFVKGWAAGQASARLRAAGFVDHLVNAGGDICASGDEQTASGAGWPVGILDPHSRDHVVEVVCLMDGAMATSGRYERGAHVIDPSSGRPAVTVDSATVVGPDPGIADACASAALVHGVASMAWFGALGPGWSLHLVTGGTTHSYGPAFDGRG
jgi:thiamine biosynthesis lipoprotein